jgi:formamidopyrimidine-DNA glycosylase
VLHLMIAGRLHWREAGAKIPAKMGMAALDFPNGSVLFAEAGTKKRAWLRLVQGEAELQAQDPGGVEVLEADLPRFQAALAAENHTVKRALTDPRLFSGIGNPYPELL